MTTKTTFIFARVEGRMAFSNAVNHIENAQVTAYPQAEKSGICQVTVETDTEDALNAVRFCFKRQLSAIREETTG